MLKFVLVEGSGFRLRGRLLQADSSCQVRAFIILFSLRSLVFYSMQMQEGAPGRGPPNFGLENLKNKRTHITTRKTDATGRCRNV